MSAAKNRGAHAGRVARILVVVMAVSGLVVLGPVGGGPSSAQAASYFLPFPAGEGYPITQGPCPPGTSGDRSHCNFGSSDRWAIDFAMSEGTGVVASAPGTVVFTNDSGNYGNVVWLDHGGDQCTQYAHLSRIDVSEGQSVSQAGAIGLSGNTGLSTGPHLHFGKVRCSSRNSFYESLPITLVETGGGFSGSPVSQNRSRPVDLDGDGTADVSDRCPTQIGPAALQGCPDGDSDGVADLDDPCAYTVGQPIYAGCSSSEVTTSGASGDFNSDGYEDVVSLYRYGPSDMGILLSPGSGSGLQWATTIAWRSGSGFEWARSKPIAGDFNGDGVTDLGVLYDYRTAGQPGATGFFVWPGGSSFGTTVSRVWYTDSGWDWSAIKLSSGDFNGDGFEDVAALYRYGVNNTGLWLSAGSASGLQWGSKLVWQNSTGFGWENSKIAAGDFNGDGATDLGLLYDYRTADLPGAAGFFVWPGGTTFGESVSRIWYTPTGWEWSAIKLSAGDFNGDGFGDITTFYRYGPSVSGILLSTGSANGLQWATSTAWKSGPWFSWEYSKPTAGDFNGDGVADFGVLAGSGMSVDSASFFVWPGGSAFGSYAPRVWSTETGWSWDATTLAGGGHRRPSFRPLSVPVRLLDSRLGFVTVDGLFAGGGVRSAGSVLELQVGGRGGVPLSARAVSLNVAVTGSSAGGWLTVFPCGGSVPSTASVNFGVGQTTSNLVTVGLGVGGRVCVFSSVGAHVIADVNGHHLN
jgi:Peptidase family M23/FG-GAP-like repeat